MDPNTVAPEGTPLEAGKPATSDFNVFFDPDFPQMSATIRDCWKVAEHHRYKSFAIIDALDGIQAILDKAVQMKPPRSPHPSQFEVAPPNTRPGNDH